MPQTIPFTCNRDCHGDCPLLATVEDGRLVRVENNPLAGPYYQGCVRGFQVARQLYAPDRLTTPLERVGPRGAGEFRPLSWDAALDRVAKRLSDLKARYGAEAILSLGASGSCRGALHHTGLLKARFFSLFGGCTATSSSYSAAAVSFATPFVLGGAPCGIDPATMRYARLIILWGANIVDTREGNQWLARLREAKAQGVPIIALEPRCSRSVRELSTEWIPVLPGTDTALMLAVLYVLLTEGLADRAFIAAHAHGFDLLERHVLGQDGAPAKTPAWAAPLCGVPAERIVAFARQYGQTQPALLLTGLSIQRTYGGEETTRLAIALQTATGNLGRKGGSAGVMHGNLPRPRVGIIGAPPQLNTPSVPVYRWPDAVIEGRAGGYPTDLRAIYNVGGNYVVEGADTHKSIRAFQSVEFTVGHDLFLTPTMRQCDIVLPVNHCLERDDIVTPGGNYVLFSNKVVDPLPETRSDFAIFAALAERLGFGAAFTEGLDEAGWIDRLLSESVIPDVAEFKRTGIYQGAEQERVGLADFAADPAAHPLPTPSGKIEIASEAYAATGGPLVPTARILPTQEVYPLRLITPKSRYRTHSQFDNIPWFKEHEPQTLWIHPADAALRGIADGQMATITSPQGCVRIPAFVTQDIMPGVVCLLEGAWPQFDVDGAEVAGSANVLTTTEPTTPSQGSRTHSILVQVESGGR